MQKFLYDKNFTIRVVFKALLTVKQFVQIITFNTLRSPTPVKETAGRPSHSALSHSLCGGSLSSTPPQTR